jgi:hypothetical protein
MLRMAIKEAHGLSSGLLKVVHISVLIKSADLFR